ncbi:hypothetical protein H072_5647 [Dactylellina haptotyla CBS 200.50]|uniref:guanylate kinase n=1 Tax=Dactylellina haptotyla (strain CBS 200.50) TaxID=1284197 RepID=S8BYR7_DACHA|nr:hypothetical protein H072_5647 [Dactylellina haptotyla CBS 200.50]
MSTDLRPIVVCGPSGVGKGTLCTKLKATNPELFKKSISHTTRQPRSGEVEGEDYYFVSPSTFSSLVFQNAFVETTDLFGSSYGTSKQTIIEQWTQGSIAVLDIDIEGAKQLKKTQIAARYIFIKPSSFVILEARLRGRESEKEDEIQDRLNRARVELAYADTPGAFDKIIINDDLETAFGELVEFVSRPVSQNL